MHDATLPILEKDEDFLRPALIATQNSRRIAQSSNFLIHLYTLTKSTLEAKFSILTPEHTKHIKPVNPIAIRHLSDNSHDDALHYIKNLKTSWTDHINKIYSCITREKLGNEMNHTIKQTGLLMSKLIWKN